MHGNVSLLTNRILSMTANHKLGFERRLYGWPFLAIAGLLVFFAFKVLLKKTVCIYCYAAHFNFIFCTHYPVCHFSFINCCVILHSMPRH